MHSLRLLMNSMSSLPKAVGQTLFGLFCALFLFASTTVLANADDCTETLKVSSAKASVAQEGNPAANAIDGNINTRWSGLGKGAHITLDLGKTHKVCKLKMAWFKDGVNGRVSSFEISGSKDGKSFANMYKGKTQSNSSMQTVHVTRRDVRYVRVTVFGNTTNDWASINEVKVLGVKDKLVCERLKPASVRASTQQDENPAANATDGNVKTRWSGLGKGAHLTLKYNQANTFCHADFAWYKGGVSGRVYDFDLYRSNDGKTFQKFYSGKSQPNTNWQKHSFKPVTARYIRLVVRGNSVNNWASVNEFHLSGAKAAGGGTPTPDEPNEPSDPNDPGSDDPGSDNPNPDAPDDKPTYKRAFYVDPAKGSDGGNGSKSRPWKTMERVLASGKLGKQVKGGDVIYLMNGYHGKLDVRSIKSSKPISMVALKGHRPKVSYIAVDKSSQLVFKGLTISPSFGASPRSKSMVFISPSSSNITVRDNVIYTVANSKSWGIKQWLGARHGIINQAKHSKVIGNKISNVRFGIKSKGEHAYFGYNVIDGFSADGIQVSGGNHSVYEYNTIQNIRLSAKYDKNHDDGIQFFKKKGSIEHIVLRGNRITSRTYPHKYNAALQGVGCFDGTLKNFLVENNVVLVAHYHGMSFYGLYDSRIVNNTIYNPYTSKKDRARLMIQPKKNGAASANIYVANNIAPQFMLRGKSITRKANLQVNQDKAKQYYVDAAKYNMHLRKGAKAIDAGQSKYAPKLDHDRKPRPVGKGFDIGAYEYRSK